VAIPNDPAAYRAQAKLRVWMGAGVVIWNNLAAKQVVRELEKNGVVCLQSFFDRRSVEKMRGEAISLLGARQWRKRTPRDLEQRFPALYEALNSDVFREIAVGYDPKCQFFCDAIVEHDTSAGEIITDIHFDMMRSLKFMIYLADVDKSSAAFRYCLGSHQDNRKLRDRFLLMGGRLPKLPNVPGPNEDHILTDIEGPSGTLIVFDTDGFHSAGLLQEGKERLLVRGRTLLSGWFDHSFLRFAAELNPLRFFAPLLAPKGRLATRGKARAKRKKIRPSDDAT
jgi:hypothetical protein